MPIEGPLRELGIHDVFQLLDLSRKTGTLHVRSSLRDNEGTIFFGGGRVIFATIRSNPHPLGEMLLRAGKVTEGDLERAIAMQRDKHGSSRLGDILIELGAITQRELERQMRRQVEQVVFELMSWHEGFFSFEEGELDTLHPEATVSISAESLMMEGARRIDEWSRISTRISDLALVPTLADAPESAATQLDLLPNEWEVLSMVDGERSVRAIAHTLGSSDFDVARVLYGLVCTGIIEVTPSGPGDDSALPAAPGNSALGIIMHAGDMRETIERARMWGRDGRAADAVQALVAALRSDPANPLLHLELGYAQAKSGRLNDAMASWSRYLTYHPRGEFSARAREASDCASRLRAVMESHYNG